MEFAELEKKMVLPYLVGEEQCAKEYAELFNGKMLDDAALQKRLIESVVSSAKNGVESFSAEYPTAQIDLSRHALRLLGMNKEGNVFTQDKNLIADAPFLLNSLIYGKGKVYSEEVATELLAYEANKKSSKYSQEARTMLDSYLSDMVMERLKKIANDAEVDNVIKQAPQVELVSVQGIEAPPILVQVDSGTPPTQEAINTVPEGAQVPSTVYDKPSASVEPSFEDISSPHIVTKELADELDERLLRLLSESDPMMQKRGFTTKVADLIKYKAQDLFDPIPLRYPSEPLFSDTLVHMDANGRASSEPLLQFKFGKVVMPNAKVDQSVYKIMAIQTLRNGVTQPHIRCDFSDPKIAQDFLIKTVDELMEVGYDINDMTVQPKMKTFFEALKASKISNEFSISQTRPDEKPELAVEPEVTLTPEETLIENNKLVTGVTETLSLNQETPIPVNQLSAANLNSVLMADVDILSQLNKTTHKEVKGYVASLVKKANPENGKTIGPRELEKLNEISVEAISNTFGDSQGKRFTEIMENVVSLADEHQLEVDPGAQVNDGYGNMDMPPLDGMDMPPLDGMDMPPLDGMDMPPYIELEMGVDMSDPNVNNDISDDSVRNDSVAEKNDIVAEKDPITLVSHGKAPYQNVKENKSSYFVKTSDGKETWGVGLKSAIEQSGAKVGDEIEFSRKSTEHFTIDVEVKNDEGVVTGKKPKDVTRTVWEVEVKPKDNQLVNVADPKVSESVDIPTADSMEEEMASRDIKKVTSDMTSSAEALVATVGAEVDALIPEQAQGDMSLSALIEMDPAELESKVLAEEQDVMNAISGVLDQGGAMLTQSELGFLNSLPNSVKEVYADKIEPILGVEPLDVPSVENTIEPERNEGASYKR
jgi:hypothetical protein